MILVLDADQAARDLAAGALACPNCAGTLRPWSWGRPRRIRQRDGHQVRVRPRRTRCADCRATHILLPAWCLPRIGQATAVLGQVLAASAAGRGYRRIAADLHHPVSTVRRWLRRVRGQHTQWLREQGVAYAAAMHPEVLADLPTQRTALGDALQALAAAVVGYWRRYGTRTDAWTLIGAFTRGRLLTPVPAD